MDDNRLIIYESSLEEAVKEIAAEWIPGADEKTIKEIIEIIILWTS